MRYKKGFSLLELIVVLTVIGILGTLGYKKYSEVMENSKAEQFLDAFKKAEMANSKVMAYAGTIRPAPIDDSGNYTDDGELRCFDFKDVDSANTYKTPLDGTGSNFDSYAITFHKSFYDELKNVGFKDKSKGGLYIQSDPRSEFLSCYKHGMRFFTVSNVKGSVALKVLKLVNNGLAPSDLDGKKADKRLAIWKLKSDGIYDHAITVDPTTPLTSTGSTSPYTNEAEIEKSPNLTITFNLTKGTKSATEW